MTAEPRGAQYGALLEYAATCCSELRFVTYPNRILREDIFDVLSPFRITSTEASSWPGSQLARGYVACIEGFKYDALVAEILLDRTNGLFDWGYPSLPDDPHWLRPDASLWLGSTVHERRGWIEVREDEFDQLLRAAPVLKDIFRPAKHRP